LLDALRTCKRRGEISKRKRIKNRGKAVSPERAKHKKRIPKPGQKLEYDIARRTDSGKTREQAIDELYKEATTSA